MMKLKLLSLTLILIFLASGTAKLMALPFELAAFERWGYPLWFMYATGVIEVVGSIALLVPRTAAVAAAGLVIVMIGAVTTHLRHAEWLMLAVASIILLLTVARAWLGYADIRSLTKPTNTSKE